MTSPPVAERVGQGSTLGGISWQSSLNSFNCFALLLATADLCKLGQCRRHACRDGVEGRALVELSGHTESVLLMADDSAGGSTVTRHKTEHNQCDQKSRENAISLLSN